MKRLHFMVVMIAALVIGACEEIGASLSITCGWIRFSYEVPEDAPPGIPTILMVAVLADSGIPIGSAALPLTKGVHHVSINFDQIYPDGTQIAIRVVADGLPSDTSPGFPCEALPDDLYVPCLVSDGRLNAYHCGSPLAIYCVGEGIDIYSVDPESGEGDLVVRLSKADIEAVGIPEGENATLIEVDGVLLSRLTDGKFQINTHYPDGKPYIIAWDGCPDGTGVEVLAW